jgi:hypothetical protein
MRIIEGAQAAIILIERGLDLDATIILRGIFEALIHLILCAKRKDYAGKYLLYFEGKRQDLLRTILRERQGKTPKYLKDWPGERKRIEGEIKRIEDLFAEKKINKYRLKKDFLIKNLSKRAGMLGHYKSFYVVTSDYVHTNANALNRFIEQGEKGDVSRISSGPTDINAKINLVAAAEVTLSTLSAASRLFGIDREGEINGFHSRLAGLMTE